MNYSYIIIERRDISKDYINELTGDYVIETSHENYSAEEIWRMYMLLTHIESS